MKYSISLDLLLASLKAAHDGKFQQSAKFYDAALRSKDLAATVASLDEMQGTALASAKKTKAEQAKAMAKTGKKPKKPETAGARMASFLKEVHAKRTKANLENFGDKKAPPIGADADTDEFNETLDDMTATTVDQILDSDLDLVDDGMDDGGETPPAAGPRPTPAVADTDPGNGESDLDTDVDDEMDLEGDDFSDLTDLSEEDFLGASSDEDEEDDDSDEDDKEDSDSDEDEDKDSESDDEDDSEDKEDKKGDVPPQFQKKDDKKEDAGVASARTKKAFTQTISNLAALDRLTSVTAGLVDGTLKQKVKAAAKPTAKLVSKK